MHSEEKNNARETVQLRLIGSKSVHLSEEDSPNWLHTIGTLLSLNPTRQNKQIRANMTNKLSNFDFYVLEIVRPIFAQNLQNKKHFL